MKPTHKYIAIAAMAVLAAACSSEPRTDTPLSPDGTRTPIDIVASMSENGVRSRAEDKTFEGGDQLLTYLRHVVDDGAGNYNSITADHAPRLVAINVNSNPTMTYVDADTRQTTSLSVDGGLYWDDFSNSSSDATDLRTPNHYLQSYYGYCYNGGTPTTALTEATGVLGWTLPAEFTADAMKRNDLLWSPTQAVITYKHDSGTRGTLRVPYSHAMSKFTIIVELGEGFADGDLASTSIVMRGMPASGTFTAPTGVIEPSAATVNPTMHTLSTEARRKSFTALAIPGKVLTQGEILAKVNNVAGNNYDIPLSAAILAADKWGSQLTDGKIKPGVHYQLTVTVNKQKIDIIAQITEWTIVKGEGEGEIKFNADVTSSGVVNTITSGSIDIFRAEELASMSAKTTTATYTAGSWVNSPEIYWANGTQSYYFRALTEYNGTTYLTVNGSNAATRGHDLLWGTTAAHLTFAEGAAINPRTGDVPLTFSHALSKLTVKLATTNDASAVDLTGAKITINDLYESGTVDVTDGTVTLGGNKSAISEAPAPISGQIVMPQTITDDIRLRVTLADNTTYSLQLNRCVVSGSSTPIGAWEQGTHYEYTIRLTKESIQVIALVKNWDEVTGSGDATLDWD